MQRDARLHALCGQADQNRKALLSTRRSSRWRASNAAWNLRNVGRRSGSGSDFARSSRLDSRV